MAKRTLKKPKRPPVTIICAFGPVTREMFEALPEHIQRRLAEIIFGDLREFAEETREREAAEMERESKTTGRPKKAAKKKGSAK